MQKIKATRAVIDFFRSVMLVCPLWFCSRYIYRQGNRSHAACSQNAKPATKAGRRWGRADVNSYRSLGFGNSESKESGSGWNHNILLAVQTIGYGGGVNGCTQLNMPQILTSRCIESDEISVGISSKNHTASCRKRASIRTAKILKCHFSSPVKGSKAFSAPEGRSIGAGNPCSQQNRARRDTIVPHQ